MSFLTSKYFGQRKYGIIYSWLYAGIQTKRGHWRTAIWTIVRSDRLLLFYALLRRRQPYWRISSYAHSWAVPGHGQSLKFKCARIQRDEQNRISRRSHDPCRSHCSSIQCSERSGIQSPWLRTVFHFILLEYHCTKTSLISLTWTQLVKDLEVVRPIWGPVTARLLCWAARRTLWPLGRLSVYPNPVRILRLPSPFAVMIKLFEEKSLHSTK